MDLDDEELKATRRINGSDKNVACIEKDIKILEEFIEDSKDYIHYSITGDELGALEHLIKAYKELEEFKKQVTEIENTNFIKYKNYIPVSLVEEKIDKTKFYIPEYQGEFVAIEDLQELLEKRK